MLGQTLSKRTQKPSIGTPVEQESPQLQKQTAKSKVSILWYFDKYSITLGNRHEI